MIVYVGKVVVVYDVFEGVQCCGVSVMVVGGVYCGDVFFCQVLR